MIPLFKILHRNKGKYLENVKNFGEGVSKSQKLGERFSNFGEISTPGILNRNLLIG